MLIPTFDTADHTFRGTKVFRSTLPAKNEDRTVVLSFKHGTMVAIFDGHYSAELSSFASEHLPMLVTEKFDPTALDLDKIISKIFEDFDQSLLEKVTELFKDKDWSKEELRDRRNVQDVLGRAHEWQDERFFVGRRAVVGTTVLIGIIDENKEHIWVISLGDSDAVRGRMEDGRVIPLIMSERHNCKNEQEVLRLAAEHPGESNPVYNGRVLSALSVTRALGDHQLKVQSRPLARDILSYLYPSPIVPSLWPEWDKRGNVTPPYLSASPVVRRYDLLPGDLLIFASDGLRDSMDRISAAADQWDSIPETHRWDVIMTLANGGEYEELGHGCIRSVDGKNPAELLIENVLWGKDAEKKARKLADIFRDDISVVVVDLAWNS